MSVHVTTKVPGMARSHQDGGCRVGEARLLRPLYYVVHTHQLGQHLKDRLKLQNFVSQDYDHTMTKT